MESVVERIKRYKQEYYKTYNYDKKSSLFNLILLLEQSIGYRDKEFFEAHTNDKRTKEIRDNKHQRMADRLPGYMEKNNDLIENLIEPYKADYVISEPYQEQHIDTNTCLKIVGDFLLSVSPYLYNVFCELYNSNRILCAQGIGGNEISVKTRDSIHVFIDSLCKVSDMATLAHEMGHAYKDYLIPTYHKAFDIEDSLHSEISSKTLELMFIMYLINNRIYYDDAIKCFNNYENFLYEKTNKYSKEKVFNAVCAKNLSYLLGASIANNYAFEPNMSYDDFIRKIYFSNIRTILKEYSKNNKVKKFHF